MSNTETNSSEIQTPELKDSGEPKTSVKKNNRTLYLMLTVAVLPVLAAYTAFFTGFGVPQETVNAGRLLSEPVHVRELFGRDQQDIVNSIIEEPKWRLFVPIFDKCEEACQKNLYTTRQVHIRLSEKSVRVKRVGLLVGDQHSEELIESLNQDHPFLTQYSVSPLRWFQWLDMSRSGLSNMQQHFYLLVDQEGYAMMVYTDKQHGNELLKDIKRALKYSIDFQ